MRIPEAIPRVNDDYTLQGLVQLIKSCPAEHNIFAIGIDLETVGLALNQTEPLSDTFMSPWFDAEETGEEMRPSIHSPLLGLDHPPLFHPPAGELDAKLSSNTNANANASASANVAEDSALTHGRRSSALDSILPACYHVPSAPGPTGKVSAFADETLFYIFYAMPGDRMQELVARELFLRNWRFHKPSKSWITTVGETHTDSFVPVPAGSTFFVFDQSVWIKAKRTLVLQAGDLEESRPLNAAAAAAPLVSSQSKIEVMHGSGTLHSTTVTH